jgi:hypothetical protein
VPRPSNISFNGMEYLFNDSPGSGAEQQELGRKLRQWEAENRQRGIGQ